MLLKVLPQITIHLTISIRPVIIEPVSDLLVDGGHGLHVGLTPLPAEILGLHLGQTDSTDTGTVMEHHSLHLMVDA